MDRAQIIRPPNLGWLEYQLNDIELTYVWNRIKNQKENWEKNLAGNIDSSFLLDDTNGWFFNHTLFRLIDAYGESFQNLGHATPITGSHPYFLNEWWVNYQKQTEFNPMHSHGGVYSFVIWMKIPIDWEEQNKDSTSRCPAKSSFQFFYNGICGDSMLHEYRLTKEDEGKLLFFPSKLNHVVYPFYNSEEERVSVSGNILVNINGELNA